MKKKNLFMVLFVLATAMFYSCGSDDSSNNNGNNDDNPTTDDNTPGVPHVMEGTWKAETFTWMPVDQVQGPFPFTNWQECTTSDYLTILSAGVAELKETKKNAEEECVEGTKTGSWTETTVTIPGEASPREVVPSENDDTLILKYVANMLGTDFEITLTYSRQ